jgi:hypothetical protein
MILVKTVYRLSPAEGCEWFDSPSEDREAIARIGGANSVSERDVAGLSTGARRLLLVHGGVKGDLADHAGNVPLLSPRAAKVLGRTLRNEGFLIEFEGPDHAQFGWVPRERTDALDRDASDVADSRYGIIEVRKHVFDIEKIRGKEIFVLPGGGVTRFTYVGEQFRDTWIEHDLQGAEFDEVWSAP